MSVSQLAQAATGPPPVPGPITRTELAALLRQSHWQETGRTLEPDGYIVVGLRNLAESYEVQRTLDPDGGRPMPSERRGMRWAQIRPPGVPAYDQLQLFL
jgi:hypothetical protein